MVIYMDMSCSLCNVLFQSDFIQRDRLCRCLQIWVRKTSDSTKMRIYLGQLQRGAFVIRRRSAAWNVPPPPLSTQPPSVQSSIHPAIHHPLFLHWVHVNWVWRVASCHVILCTTTTSYSPLWPRISQWTFSVVSHNPNASAGVMVISTAACHCVVSSSKGTLILIWCFQHQCFPHHAVLFTFLTKLFFLTRSLSKPSLSLSYCLTGVFCWILLIPWLDKLHLTYRRSPPISLLHCYQKWRLHASVIVLPIGLNKNGRYVFLTLDMSTAVLRCWHRFTPERLNQAGLNCEICPLFFKPSSE